MPSLNTKTINPLIKLLIEAGPIIVFFGAYMRSSDIIFATKIYIAIFFVSVSVSFILERKIPVMPLITAIVVIIFGGLTIYLNDELFIKLKPTVVNLIFAFIIFTGLMLKRNFIKIIFRSIMDLNDEGWSHLAKRWGLFFILLAVLNEVVWRNFSTDTWVAFKLFGILPLTLIFSISQAPLIMRHSQNSELNN